MIELSDLYPLRRIDWLRAPPSIHARRRPILGWEGLDIRLLVGIDARMVRRGTCYRAYYLGRFDDVSIA